MLSKGITRAIRSAQRIAGVSATYRRGSASLTLTLIRGRSDVVSSLDEIEDNWTGIDWLALAAQLILNGQPIRPQPGDLIEVGTDVYEVMPQDDACYSLDPTHTLLRIHTKQID